MMRSFIGVMFIIALLGIVILPGNHSVISQEEEKLEYVGATKCKFCHNRASTGKIFDDWEQDVHANAWDLLSDDEKNNPDCQKCHTTGHGEPGGFVSFEETPAMVSIQCEECHGPGELHIKSKPNDVIPHAWDVSAEVCAKCHREEGNPNWDPNRYTLPDGSTSGFYFEEAVKKVNHSKALEEANN